MIQIPGQDYTKGYSPAEPEESAIMRVVRAAKRAPPDCGWVYAVAEPGTWIKIGWTSEDPERRLSHLQTGNPRPLRLVDQIQGTRELERALHDLWADRRGSGEWFDFTWSASRDSVFDWLRRRRSQDDNWLETLGFTPTKEAA